MWQNGAQTRSSGRTARRRDQSGRWLVARRPTARRSAESALGGTVVPEGVSFQAEPIRRRLDFPLPLRRPTASPGATPRLLTLRTLSGRLAVRTGWCHRWPLHSRYRKKRALSSAVMRLIGTSSGSSTARAAAWPSQRRSRWPARPPAGATGADHHGPLASQIACLHLTPTRNWRARPARPSPQSDDTGRIVCQLTLS